MEFLYLPLTLYIFTIGFLRTGRFFYFAAANPKVSLGGFAGDSKYAITKQIPLPFRPISIKISKHILDFDLVKQDLQKYNFRFPVIAKPDLGEAGFLVKKIESLSALETYHFNHQMDYIIQEFIDFPLEVSVLIHNSKGKTQISSITEKKYLTLIGDGFSNIETLLERNEAVKYHIQKVKKQLKNKLNQILKKGQVYQPLQIGSRASGALYINRSDLITKTLNTIFDDLNSKIALFDYARYDIKAESILAFQQGQFKVLEINGTKGEPIHIYDKNTSLWQAYKEIFKHWEYILKISKRNIKQGAKCPSFRKGWQILLAHRQSKKDAMKIRENELLNN